MTRLSGGRSARQYMLWAFKLRGCIDCGYLPRSKADLANLQCDHRDPSEKIYFQSRGMTPAAGLLDANSLDVLLEELFKCDPVCVPCHIKRGKRRSLSDPPSEPSRAAREWMDSPIPELYDWTQEGLWGDEKEEG